jgi:hypothetical protein
MDRLVCAVFCCHDHVDQEQHGVVSAAIFSKGVHFAWLSCQRLSVLPIYNPELVIVFADIIIIIIFLHRSQQNLTIQICIYGTYPSRLCGNLT